MLPGSLWPCPLWLHLELWKDEKLMLIWNRDCASVFRLQGQEIFGSFSILARSVDLSSGFSSNAKLILASISTYLKMRILNNEIECFVFFSLDSRNTKKLKTKMPSFYKQQTYFSQIVSKKATITILFSMKNSKNNNIIFVISI